MCIYIFILVKWTVDLVCIYTYVCKYLSCYVLIKQNAPQESVSLSQGGGLHF